MFSTRKCGNTFKHTRGIHKSEQSGVADRRDADDRLRAVCYAHSRKSPQNSERPSLLKNDRH